MSDPSPSSGAREGKCKPSVVAIPDGRWRDVVGIVRRGESGVAGAIVRIEPTEGFLGERGGRVASTMTDGAGFFGPLSSAALRYDISVRAGDDVLVYRGAAGRYLEPFFEASSSTPARSWLGRLDVQLEQPLPEGRAVTFFATGKALAVVGDLERGIGLVGSDYTFPATVHAVVYEKDGDLSTASAYGKVDVIANPDVPQLARLSFEPIKEFRETKVTVSAPGGYTPRLAEVLVGYSRTSYAPLATIPIGVTRRLPVIPNHGYHAYRVRASLPDGAVSDSGEKFFDIFSSENKIELPLVPRADAPSAGASLASSDRLEARGKGLLEHVLVPKRGAGTIRVVTREPVASLPDVAELGASPPRGEYSWTVRSYPEIRFVDGFGGSDGARFFAVGISAPRSIVFR